MVPTKVAAGARKRRSRFGSRLRSTSIAAQTATKAASVPALASAAMLVLRRREPDRERKFRAPAATLVATVGILGCIYLFISLPNRTQLFFFAAQAIGIVLYFIYGHGAAARARASKLA